MTSTSFSSAFCVIEKTKIFDISFVSNMSMFKKRAEWLNSLKPPRKFLWISANFNKFKKKFYLFFQIFIIWRKKACAFSLFFRKQTCAALPIKNWWFKESTFKTRMFWMKTMDAFFLSFVHKRHAGMGVTCD